MINHNYWTPNYVWPTYLGRLMASVRFLLPVCLNSKTLRFYFFYSQFETNMKPPGQCGHPRSNYDFRLSTLNKGL